MDESPNYDDLLKLLECTVLSDLSESSQKLGSLEWSMQQEVANAEEKKAEVMRGRYDLQTKLSVMMNLTGKFKTEETKSINHLQASFKEMAHLEEESVTQSNIMWESFVQLNNDEQKLNVMSENEMEDLAIEVQTMTEVAKQYEWYLTAQDGDTEIDAFRRIVQEENLGLELVRKENSQVLREIANLMKKNILD